MGADVITAISSSTSKHEAAIKFGATDFLSLDDEDAVKQAQFKFDVILNTVCADLDWSKVMSLLAAEGTLVQVGTLKSIKILL
jgi:D-arabinose 1-dehydrogenase-like Zn-dependent alcohol dehydrogenase